MGTISSEEVLEDRLGACQCRDGQGVIGESQSLMTASGKIVVCAEPAIGRVREVAWIAGSNLANLEQLQEPQC